MTVTTVASYTPADRVTTAYTLGGSVASILVSNDTPHRLDVLTSTSQAASIAPYDKVLLRTNAASWGAWLALSPYVQRINAPYNASGTVTVTSYDTGDAVPDGTTYETIYAGPALVARHDALDLLTRTEPINVRMFGAAGDGTTDDWTAFTRAIAVCNTLGCELFLPAGNYAMTIASTGLSVNGCPAIRGENRNATTITALNGALAANTPLFAPVAGTTVTIEDMTAAGPTTPNSHTSYFVKHAGTSGSLTVRRVTLTQFTQPIEADDGATVSVVVDSVDVTGVGSNTSALVFLGDIKRARVYNSSLHAYGIAASNQAHGIYVHKGVDFEATGCSFDNNLGIGWSIHNFNGAGTSTNMAVIDCYFASDSYQGVLTNPTVRARIIGCRFTGDHAGVSAQFDCDIMGCQFSNTTFAASPINQVTAASNSRVRGCTFVMQTTGINAITLTASGSTWRIDGCQFGCNRSLAVSAGAGCVYVLGPTCEYADDGAAHLVVATNTTAPTLSGLAGTLANVTITGDDTHGLVQFDNQTSTISSGSALFTVTFNKAYANTPLVFITNEATNLAGIGYGASGVSTTAFTVRNIGTQTVIASNKVVYLVIGQ